MNLLMLVCASVAAMVFGVLAAYAIFKGGFALMRWHTRQSAPAANAQAKPQVEVA